MTDMLALSSHLPELSLAPRAVVESLDTFLRAQEQTLEALLASQEAVLDFIFAHCQRYAEPEWRRYPVLSVI